MAVDVMNAVTRYHTGNYEVMNAIKSPHPAAALALNHVIFSSGCRVKWVG